MDQENKKQSILGGSLFLKIIVIFAVGLIIFTLLGGIKNAQEAIFSAIKIIFGIIIIFFVFKGILSYFKPKPYSPTEDFKSKVIRAGKQRKPFNVKRLYIRGEDMLVYSKWFDIKGILFIPYLTSKPKTDDTGKVILINKKDVNDMPIIDKDTGKAVLEPEREMLSEKNGEWAFIGDTGSFFDKKSEIVRAHYSLCSAIGENIYIKTPNLVPIGDYLYPTQQWQDDILKVLTQHKAEAVIQSYENFLDLVSNVAQMALGADPTFQKIMQAQSEALGQRNQGILNRQ